MEEKDATSIDLIWRERYVWAGWYVVEEFELTITVITDPDDKNFDLEAYLQKVAADSWTYKIVDNWGFPHAQAQIQSDNWGWTSVHE